MGSGILPVAEHNGQIYFLFGQEVYDKKWSDFGGRGERHESDYDTALREGYEEIDGFFGTKSELRNLVNNNFLIELKIKRGHNSYLFKIPYDWYLPVYFNNHHQFIKKNFPSSINKNGFFEKSTIKWFSLKDIKEHNNFRSFYKEIIEIIINNYEQIKDLTYRVKI
jgi:hypothetical protein